MAPTRLLILVVAILAWTGGALATSLTDPVSVTVSPDPVSAGNTALSVAVGFAADPGPGTVTVTVSDAAGGSVTNSAAASGVTTTVPVDVASLADGTLTVSATFTDGTGATGAPATTQAFKDTVAPTVTLNATGGQAATVTVTSDEPLASLSVQAGPETLSLADFTGDTATVQLPDGTHEIAVVSATDGVGNAAGAVPATSVAVDATPPSVTLLAPTDALLTDASPTVSATVTDTIALANVSLTVTDATGATTLVPGDAGVTLDGSSFTADLAAAGVTITDGNASLTLAATDTTGNVASASHAFEMDALGPAVSTFDFRFTNGELRLEVDAGEPLSTLRVDVDGPEGYVLTKEDFTVAGTRYTVYRTPIQGTYRVTLLEATDAVGNPMQAPRTATATTDVISPFIEEFAVRTTDSTVTVTVVSSEPLDTFTVQLVGDGRRTLDENDFRGFRSYSYTLPNARPGGYRATLLDATDAAGNAATVGHTASAIIEEPPAPTPVPTAVPATPVPTVATPEPLPETAAPPMAQSSVQPSASSLAPVVVRAAVDTAGVTAGEELAVFATVYNPAPTEAELAVKLYVDGVPVETVLVVVPGETATELLLTETFVLPGEYTVRVGEVDAGTVTVWPAGETPAADPAPASAGASGGGPDLAIATGVAVLTLLGGAVALSMRMRG
ncbi:hypothetical protein [Natronomonas sp. EA1]|uniref:hypothetical protein n=1 Tax=Natronomonas sp. EA1 TaxID=3421655 RepID=UPI003EB87B18